MNAVGDSRSNFDGARNSAGTRIPCRSSRPLAGAVPQRRPAPRVHRVRPHWRLACPPRPVQHHAAQRRGRAPPHDRCSPVARHAPIIHVVLDAERTPRRHYRHMHFRPAAAACPPPPLPPGPRARRRRGAPPSGVSRRRGRATPSPPVVGGERGDARTAHRAPWQKKGSAQRPAAAQRTQSHGGRGEHGQRRQGRRACPEARGRGRAARRNGARRRARGGEARDGAERGPNARHRWPAMPDRAKRERTAALPTNLAVR